MKPVADSSFFAYGRWYLEREERKWGRLDHAIPKDEGAMQSLFETPRYEGKYRPWFPRGNWSICQLDEDEFNRLMIVDGPETRSEQLVIERIPRTLKNAARNAVATGYFETMRRTRERHFWYYLSHLIGSLSLKNENRLAVCTLNKDERGESKEGTFSCYLHDGWGRALPYMVLLFEERVKYIPVEVFLAREG